MFPSFNIKPVKSWSMYSNTIYMLLMPLLLRLVEVTISFNSTILSWRSSFRIFISRIAVIGNYIEAKVIIYCGKEDAITPSFSLSIRTFFKATMSPVSLFFAM